MGWQKTHNHQNTFAILSWYKTIIFFRSMFALVKWKLGGGGKYFFTSQVKHIVWAALKWLGLFSDPDLFWPSLLKK